MTGAAVRRITLGFVLSILIHTHPAMAAPYTNEVTGPLGALSHDELGVIGAGAYDGDGIRTREPFRDQNLSLTPLPTRPLRD